MRPLNRQNQCKIKRMKQTNKQKNGLAVGEMTFGRPMSPEIYSQVAQMLTYVKRPNEIEISFYNIALFITVTLKMSSDRSPRASHQKVYLQTTHS